MKNTYDRFSFVVSSIIWSFLSWFWYKGILFKTIGNYSLSDSKLILFLVLSLSGIFGFLLQQKSRRNGFSIFMNISIGYGVYTILTYRIFNPEIVFWTEVVVGSLIVIYAFLLLRNKSQLPQSRCSKTKVKTFLNGVQAIVTCGCIAIIGIYTLRVTLHSSIAHSKVSANKMSDESISENFDGLSLLYEETWERLSLDEKISVLQLVANIECTNLGLPHELNVCVLPLADYESGNYSDNTHSITINSSDVMQNDPSDLVNTICHESYHAYEHRLIDMYESSSEQYGQLKVFEYVVEYRNEFNNYTEYYPELDNFDDYYYQLCESDARDYADMREFEYYISFSYDYAGKKSSPLS